MLAVIAAALLGLGIAAMTGRSKLKSVGRQVGVAVGAAGFTYAVCNVIIRTMVTHHATLAGTLLIFSMTGVVGLGLSSIWRLGVPTLAETSTENLCYMLLGGVFNAVAFYAIAKGLQVLTVARVNALNATSLAMMALVGTVFFKEAVSLGLLSGVTLMVAGIFLIHRGA